MSRISDAFKNGKAFIPFLTAGDPTADATVNFIFELERAGASVIEIGVPFSDPIAEGPVIQEANIRALSNGMTTDGVFEIVKRVREKSNIPICLMGYLNPVFHYGYERFFAKCQEVGVDGIIIADMPYEERMEAKEVADKYGIDVVALIAPTSEQRIQMIAKEATGYIYLVSSMGVTGMRSEITTDIEKMVKAIKEVSDTPVAVGFGISTPAQAADMAGKSDGAIVGSAIVKKIAEHGENAAPIIYEYVKSMVDAVKAL